VIGQYLRENIFMKIFEHPDVIELYKNLSERIFAETGRGAILISTSFVDEQLTNLILSVLPSSKSKNLLNYPGPLSSFSAKIELSYAFRLIDENTYDRLNSLRKIRNDAAHSSSPFDLNEIKSRLDGVYKIAPSMPSEIRNIAMNIFIKSKIYQMEVHFDNLGLSSDEKKAKIEEMFGEKEALDIMEKQIPHFELLVGICFLCALIIFQKEKLLKVLKDGSTWIGLDANPIY
jgi:hypothetical protein